ncbi:hypothetical protein Tco_1304402 [Tanacetum coccineum]
MKLHGILQFWTKPGKQVRDYKDVTKESVQANVINKVKNFLPKFLPKAVKDALEKTPLPFAQSSSPDQSAIKAVESHSEYEMKKILYAKMNKSQSHLTHDTHQELYDALTWSIRTGKDVESSKKPSKYKESAKHKTPSITSKSGKSISAYKSVHEIKHIVQIDVKEPNLTNVADDANEPQSYTTLKIPKKDWFKKSPRLEILDPDWNTVKIIDDASEQPWFNEMIQVEKPPLMFDELMSTPIDFFAFTMNRLKLNKITIADLVGLVFNLLKGTCKSYVELEYNMEECYRALTDQLDWTNLEGHKSPVDMSKPLPLQDKEARNKDITYSSFITKTPATRYTMEGIEDMIPTMWSQVIIAYDKDAALGISHRGPQRQQFYRAMINTMSKHEVFSTMRILSVVSVQIEKKSGYGYLKEIVVRQADQKLYRFKEGDFSDLHLNDIKDMLLLITQNKLFNLDGGVIVDFVIALKMFTRGIIVKNRVEDVQLGVKSYQRKLNLTRPQRTCLHILIKEPYTSNFDPPGVIYEDICKKKRLMHVDEIHKFCDKTLQSVRNTLHERLLNFKFGYNKDMPSKEWTSKDKRRIGIMVNKIDDRLFKRRILRSLKVLVGARKTKMDKQLLQRTV